MPKSRPGPHPSLHSTLGGLLLCLLGAAAAPAQDVPASDTAGHEAPTVVFVVRHAEKMDDRSGDPGLTPEGEARARALARTLRSVDLDRIHSTPTLRTLSTAAPVRRDSGARIRAYHANALEPLAARIRAHPGRHLVVGHSNTVPDLVRLLGGEPGPPIAAGWEYDRLYVLTLRPEAGTGTVLLRYGERSTP